MPYPVGITTRAVTMGGETALESGESLILQASVKASRGLIWRATGWHYQTVEKVYTSDEGAELTIPLVCTDLAGPWGLDDDSGTVLDMSAPGSYSHRYTIKLVVLKSVDGRLSKVGERTYNNVTVPTGDLSPFDLDAMLPVSTVAGGVVLVPDMWSTRLDALEAGGGGSATRGLIVTAVDVPTIPAGDTTDNLAAYYNSAAVPITVAGVELAAGRHAVWAWVGGAWVLLSSGTSTPPDPSDTTAPVWTAALTTGTPTDTAVVIAASALATDNVAVTGYRWRLTGEGVGVARTITPSGLSFTLDGLTASTSYAAPIFWAVDAGGNKSSELTAQAFTTDAIPPGWVTIVHDTFTDTDGTLLAAHTPDTGAAWKTPQAPGLTIYGNRLRPSRTADFTGGSRSHGSEVAVALASKKVRLTLEFNSGGLYEKVGLNAMLNNALQNYFSVSWYVGSTISVDAYNLTATETSGLTTTAPASGTAVFELDAAGTSGTLHINGTLYRSWTFDWQGRNFTSFGFHTGGNDIYDGLAVGAMSASWLDAIRIEHWQ